MASNSLRSMTKDQLIRLIGQMQDELAAARTERSDSSSTRYRDIFRASLDATIVEDDDGRIREANPAACELFGYKHDEWPGVRVEQLVHPASMPEVELVRKSKPSQSHLRLKLLRRDQSVFNAEVMALRTTISGRESIVVIVHDLSGLLDAQQLLETSEKTLNEAQELAGLGSYVWDLRDDSLTWSRNMYAIAGLNIDNFAGNLSQTMMDIIHPEDRDRVRREVAEMVERKETRAMEFRIVRPDGRLRHLRSGSRFVFDETGRPIKCVGVHYDITDYKETAWALAHSKANFEALVENLADAVFAHDLDGNLIMVNKLACENTGYTREELLGLSVADIDSGSVSRDDQKRFWFSLQPGESVTIEAEHRRKDGSTYPAEIKINRIDIGGHPAMVGLARDITRRKQAVQELSDNRAGLRTLIDASPDSMLLIDPDDTIIECNQVVERVFGQSREELIGSNAYDMIGPEVARLRRAKVSEVVDTGRPVRFVDERFGRTIVNTVSPIFDEGGKVTRIAICGSDITDQRRLSEEREAMLHLLQIGSNSSSLRELIKSAVESLSRRFDFEAVGIRLRSGDDFPYFETRGFAEEFVQAETSLCVRNPDGQVRRDRLGNPVLECMCGNIIRGRFNSDLPFFTEHGSFWSNSTTELLGSTSEEDRQARTRNRCNGEGYESVGLFPLRSGGETFGLLQMNDHRRERFTPELVDLFERLAGSLAAAVGHFMLIEQLQQSEAEKSLILDSSWEMFAHLDRDLQILWGNKASGDSVGLSRKEIIGRHCYELWQNRSEPCENCPVLKARDTGEAHELEMQTPDGRWFHLRGYPVFGVDGKVESLIEYGRDVTEEKRAERALRESEEKWRGYVENAPYGVFVADEEGRYIDTNPAAIRITGHSREELLRMRIGEMLAPDAREEGLRHFRRVVEEGSATGEYAFIRRDGEKRYWSVSAVAVAPDRFLAFVEDVSDRKKGEQALRESERKFRGLVENVVDWIWQVDKNGAYTYVSPQVETIMGYEPSEIVGKTPFDFMSGEEASRIAAIFSEAVAGKKRIYGLEDTMQARDGRPVIFETNATPLLDANGELTGYMGTCRDITDRKKAKQALRESEDRYRSLVENMQVGVALIDKDMRMVSINRQFREWFPGIEVEGHAKCFELLCTPAKDGVCPGCCVQQTLREGTVQERITTIETARGAREIREVASPIRSGGNKPVAATLILEDITDRLSMEEELAKAEKLESIGVLAGGIAHDFNNILVAILGNISLARMELPEDSEVSSMLSDAEHASERARNLTQQLLTFAKGGSPVTKSTDIKDLISESATFTLRGSNSRCEFEFADDLWQAQVDPGQFSQVIGNLVINAAQAMPQGGVVTIRGTNVPVVAPSALPLRSGNYVLVTVSDTGIGIQEEMLARIFDPFFTTKDKGNGLGLTSCYSIVKRHGGHINVSSQPDQGTTFSVYIPASAAELESNRQPKTELVRGSGRILVVDDESSVLDLAAHLLTRLGYEPATAANGSDAIGLAWEAYSGGEPFAAAIIDLTIPGGMGGVEIHRELKRIDPGIKTIVSSGYYNDPIMSRFDEHGFVGCIAKPYKTEEFSRALSEVLGEVGAKD